MIWMESAMYEDELISLDDMRQCEEPVSMSRLGQTVTDLC